MCEPYHSIVQYPVDDDDDITGQSNRLQWGLGKIYEWGKKIGKWFHFSKLGSGHTESIEWARTKHLILPDDIRYEGAWWNRTVRLDMPFQTIHDAEAKNAASQYCNVSVIGSIGKFRRFFETSIEKTDYPTMYIEMFVSNMLTVNGRIEVMKKIHRVFGRAARLERLPRDKIAKLLLGYTRKRNLLVPEWADNDTLWTPG